MNAYEGTVAHRVEVADEPAAGRADVNGESSAVSADANGQRVDDGVDGDVVARDTDIKDSADTATSGPTAARAEAATAGTECASTAPTAQRGDATPRKRGFWQRRFEAIEARLSRLSTRNNFWHRLFAWVFLPLAYRSGIRFSHGDESTFSAILPFRKFNKNWYNAMAGGALLGNAEVAGGMYLFRQCGADYTLVCKHLEYTFRRPCHGPAVYRVEPRQDIQTLLDQHEEFNITVDMTIVQMVRKPDQKERRCGHCVASFHITHKEQVRRRSKPRGKRELRTE